MPVDLLGDWYMEGKIYLTVTEDTLNVSGYWAPIQSVAKSYSYYRIIYKSTERYYAIYLQYSKKEEVQIVHAESNAVDEERASALPVTGIWYTLTSTNPWIPTNMPGVLPGNWHISDGEMEIVIDKDKVILDGEVWEIDSVQTNRTVYRLILKKGENYKSFYYKDVGPYNMNVLIIDGKEDIQDRYGNVPGEWNKLYKWWNFNLTSRNKLLRITTISDLIHIDRQSFLRRQETVVRSQNSEDSYFSYYIIFAVILA